MFTMYIAKNLNVHRIFWLFSVWLQTLIPLENMLQLRCTDTKYKHTKNKCVYSWNILDQVVTYKSMEPRRVELLDIKSKVFIF